MTDNPATDVQVISANALGEAAAAPPTSQETQYNAPFSVSISFPESVVIKMVDATALNDYEVGLFFSSLFASVFVGFLVAFIQDPARPAMLVIVALIFGFSGFGFFVWALSKRRRMTARSRSFKLRTSSVEEVKEA
jgi:hypothetical protein